jgi:hypothetical protein
VLRRESSAVAGHGGRWELRSGEGTVPPGKQAAWADPVAREEGVLGLYR